MRILTYRTAILLGVFVTLLATADRTLAANDAAETHALEPTALVGIAVMLVIAKLGSELFERMLCLQ